jgi:hypothetical protein
MNKGHFMLDFIFEVVGRFLIEVVWEGIWRVGSFIFGGIGGLIKQVVGGDQTPSTSDTPKAMQDQAQQSGIMTVTDDPAKPEQQ